MSNAETKEQILALIGTQPNIRDVEISDRLDIDVERIRPLIQAEINAGKVGIEKVRAPNQLMIDSYRLISPEMAVKKTKADIALAYLREHGPVTNEYLVRALGLKKGEFPGNFLTSALKDKRLVFANKLWSVGPGAVEAKPAAPVAKKAAEQFAPKFPAAKAFTVPVVEKVAEKVTELAPKAAPVVPIVDDMMASIEKLVANCKKPAEKVADAPQKDPAASRFIAGLQSDGTLRLDVDGAVIELKKEYATELHDYLKKVGYAILS